MILKNANICQFKNGSYQPIFGNMHINDGVITKIEENSFEKYVEQNNAKTLRTNSNLSEYDAQGRLVLAPLINFHEHIYSRLSKGLPVTGDLSNFLNVLKNLWWKLDRALFREAIETSAQIASIEAIKNGVGTIFDHHASPNFAAGSLAIIKKVLKERGLDAVLSYEVSDRNGIENMKESVQENLDFIRFQTSRDCKAQFGLHALFTLNDDTLQYIRKQTADFQMGFHIHVAEDKYDIDFNQEKYNISLIERLKKFDLINETTFLAHCNHLPKAELESIAREKATIVHNPDSNFNNAVGVLNLLDVPENCKFVLGTDGMHCNILRTLKMAFLNARHQNRDSTIGFEIIERIMRNSFASQELFFGKAPKLRINDPADFIVLDYIPYTPLDANNFLGHFLYGATEVPVRTMYKNGYFLMKDFEIEQDSEIYQKSYAIGKEVREQFEKL